LCQALLTAELGTTFPEAGAGVAWVEEAFGPSAGWMCGYLGWMAGGTILIYCTMAFLLLANASQCLINCSSIGVFDALTDLYSNGQCNLPGLVS
jgi:amino acid transporter